MSVRVLVVLALLFFASIPHVSAQSLDGTYNGTIGCLSRGGLRPLQTPLRMIVSGETATYDRELMGPGSNCPPGGCPTGNFERGTGTVTPSGEVTLRGKAEGKGARSSYAFEAETRANSAGTLSALLELSAGLWMAAQSQSAPVRSVCPHREP